MALTVIVAATATSAQTETIRVTLKLHTGGALTGLVVDATDHGLVVVAGATPYVLSWGEIDAGSAYAAKRDWLAVQRGGREHLTAEDHFQLGHYALSRDRNDLAATEFRRAKKLDHSYTEPVRDAFDDYRKRKRTLEARDDPLVDAGENAAADVPAEGGLPEKMNVELFKSAGATTAVGTTAEIRARALEIYNTFGERVREVIAKDLVFIETDHFLIWTDWKKQNRARLADWFESMYSALCEQFDFDLQKSVFLAKCPVFSWRSKARFLRFARGFDGYDGKDSIGYSRSIEENGHVHLVLVRNGRSQADYDRFACTLVHEGTHAFLHRFHTTRLIPHWVNEGCADLVAAHVLGDRCPNAGNAALLAKQYVRYDWTIGNLFNNAGPIAVHQYPLAHSIVAHMESLGSKRLAGFVKSLKSGASVTEALAANYEGMTPAQLEAGWRQAVRENHPVTLRLENGPELEQ
ncbi:MAG: hypothetical protein ACYTFA_09390 [Planctomycetota bacterium]